VVTTENLREIRLGCGLPPKYYDILLGKKVARDAKAGQQINWDLIGENHD